MDIISSQTFEGWQDKPQALDSWAFDLESVCGHFDVRSLTRNVCGVVRQIDACGLTFAHVANDLDRVVRTFDGIRRDQYEHLFLVVQLGGQCGVVQGERESHLRAGDCILIDSTRPFSFEPEGRFCNHLSLHLPRQLMFSGTGVSFDVARKLESDDAMAVMLRALLAKAMETPTTSPQALPLRDLVLGAARQAFFTAPRTAALLDSSAKRRQVAEVLIDRHLTEPYLSGKWVADRLGVSLRTLQEDFQQTGITCTMLIRDRRLRLAREKLGQRGTAGSIADIAFGCGFNDISYFNRSFRELFSCAPGDVTRKLAG
jgi:AraC-like DNA-binding protein